MSSKLIKRLKKLTMMRLNYKPQFIAVFTKPPDFMCRHERFSETVLLPFTAYSAIHKAARLCVPAGTLFRDHSPIHVQWTLFHSAGIVPGKSKELPGTREAGSFVNCAVKGFFHSTGIVPAKAGNGSADGLVNSTVNFTLRRNLVFEPFISLHTYARQQFHLNTIFTKFIYENNLI